MINRNELEAICPDDRQKLSLMTDILRRNWCPFVVSMGHCNNMCSANEYCVTNLGKIINGIRPDAIRWQSVMVWRIRNQRGELKERFEQPSLAIDHWGQVKTGNGLQELSQELGIQL
jgi:hypothetical protein